MIKKIKDNFPELDFKFHFDLKPITYFKIGGPAEAFVSLDKTEDIIRVVNYCQKENIKYTILGGASNVVVADEGIKGVVIQITTSHIDIGDKDNRDLTSLICDAGTKTASLVKKSVDVGLTGLEYFLGVPGTVGGAVYNNAHYLSDLIAEYIHQVEIIDEAGEIKWLDKNECDFGYDSSRFHQTREVILRVEFHLPSGDLDKSQQKIKEATLYRAHTQPLGPPSSGCIFQNTPNTEELKKLFPEFSDRSHVPCGFLIDEAGLKGEKVGDIEVSHKHAAFFINLGQGTAQDFKNLVSLVKDRVHDKFGVQLREEVFYLS